MRFWPGLAHLQIATLVTSMTRDICTCLVQRMPHCTRHTACMALLKVSNPPDRRRAHATDRSSSSVYPAPRATPPAWPLGRAGFAMVLVNSRVARRHQASPDAQHGGVYTLRRETRQSRVHPQRSASQRAAGFVAWALISLPKVDRLCQYTIHSIRDQISICPEGRGPLESCPAAVPARQLAASDSSLPAHAIGAIVPRHQPATPYRSQRTRSYPAVRGYVRDTFSEVGQQRARSMGSLTRVTVTKYMTG